MADEPVKPADSTETTSTTPPVEAEKKTTSKRKKAKRSVPNGEIHINASFNNTIITITDQNGAVIAGASAGSSGFRGSKKGTAFAAQIAAEKAFSNANQTFGLAKARVTVRGIGAGRESALRSLSNSGIQVESIRDATPIAHGGTRPPKARRV